MAQEGYMIYLPEVAQLVSNKVGIFNLGKDCQWQTSFLALEIDGFWSSASAGHALSPEPSGSTRTLWSHELTGISAKIASLLRLSVRTQQPGARVSFRAFPVWTPCFRHFFVAGELPSGKGDFLLDFTLWACRSYHSHQRFSSQRLPPASPWLIPMSSRSSLRSTI